MSNENLVVVDLKDYDRLQKAFRAGRPFCVQSGHDRFMVTKDEPEMTREEAEEALVAMLNEAERDIAEGRVMTYEELGERLGIKNV
jgi:hypothetical protein